MFKFTLILLFCQIALSQGYSAFAEDYSECRMRCDREYNDCFNEPPSPEPEVQDARMAACDRNLKTCSADCEGRKPIENPETGSNPGIIYK